MTNKSFSWSETVRSFVQNLWPVFAAHLLMYSMVVLFAILYILALALIFPNVVTQFANPQVALTNPLLYFFVALMPIQLLMLWPFCGLANFLLSLIKTGTVRYRQLFSVTGRQLLYAFIASAFTLIPLAALLQGVLNLFQMTGYDWLVFLLFLLSICLLSRLVFLIFAIVSGYGPLEAISKSIQYANQYNMAVIALTIMASGYVLISFIDHRFGPLPMGLKVLMRVAGVLLSVFVSYAAAVLYIKLAVKDDSRTNKPA